MLPEKKTDVCDIQEDEDEPGEVIESAPPLQVGEEREIGSTFGLKKKLLRTGVGWESPSPGDEVTVHYVGTLPDGTKFVSTRDEYEPFTFKLGQGKVVKGLNQGIITMRKGEIAVFTLQPEMGYGAAVVEGVPPDSIIQFELELISWITVVDVLKDDGIIKKIIKKGDQTGPPDDLDEVLVKYQVMLADGTVVAKTPNEGVKFYVKDGHFCPALAKAIKTMKTGEKVCLCVQPQYAFGVCGKDFNHGLPAIPPSSMLSIFLELVTFKPVINVTGDSKVIKKILKEGEGSLTADEGASVTIRYSAMLEDGTIFDKRGFNGEEGLEFITDEEQVIFGLDRAATTMKKGERAMITISPEYGFGSDEVKRDLACVPSSSTVYYDVEMLDFIKEKALWEMSNKERTEAAGRLKEEGSLLFKNGKYQRAVRKYDKAVDYVSEDGIFEHDERKLVKSLRVSCWLNGAACCLKLKDFQGAIRLCSKVLDIQFYNIKALYRRAQAYMETEDLHLADLDIRRALDADPQSRDLKTIQRNLKQLQVETGKRDAKLYMNMFSRMTNDSSVATKRLKVEQVVDSKEQEMM